MLTFAAALGLSACGDSEISSRQVATNPDPHRSILVEGDFAPRFKLTKLAVTYSTRSPWVLCNRYFLGDGFFVSHLRTTVAVPLSINDGHAEANIQVDKFRPGFCRWHLDDVTLPVGGVDGGGFGDILGTTDPLVARHWGYTDRALLAAHQRRGVVFAKCGYGDHHYLFCAPLYEDEVPIVIDENTTKLGFSVQASAHDRS